jgi:hypothetical protein
METTQSKLDLLKQENARLMARITELEQIAKEKNKLFFLEFLSVHIS